MVARLLTSKRTLAVLLLLVFVFAGIGSANWPISKERLEGPLRSALQRDTAYHLEGFREASFQALPWPTIDVSHLELKKPGPSTERASIRQLRGRINLASWLIGQPRIVELRIDSIQVHLTSNDKLEETEALSTAIFGFLRQGNRPELRHLRIDDAQIFRDGKPWIERLILNVHNVATRDLRLRVSADYQGLAVQLRAEIAQGDSSEGRAITWDVQLPGLQSQFAGRLFGSRSLDAEGFSKTLVSSGSGYAKGLGLSGDLARLFNNLSVEGATRVSWPSLQMRQAQVRFDKNVLDGSVEFSLDKAMPGLSATLGASTLDFNTRLAAWTSHLPKEKGGSWPEERVAPDWLNAGRADIRLSADKVLMGTITLEKVALASQLRDGRLDVILSEAQFKSGTFRGRGQMRQVETSLETRSSLQFDQIDLEALQKGFGFQRLKGLATGQLAIEASGSNLRAMMQSNTGKGSLMIRNGEFVGLDMERLMARLDRNNPAPITPSGRTRFRSLASEFTLSAGTIKLSPSPISTFGLIAPVNGTIDLQQQDFDLSIKLTPVLPVPRLGGAALRVTGPWNKPVFATEWGAGG